MIQNFLFYFIFIFFIFLREEGGGGDSLSPPRLNIFYSGQYGSNDPPRSRRSALSVKMTICNDQADSPHYVRPDV